MARDKAFEKDNRKGDARVAHTPCNPIGLCVKKDGNVGTSNALSNGD